MATALGRLHEVIDEVAALDPVVLDDADLHGLVVALQRERARLGVLAAQLLGRWDARRVWAGDGSCSAAARLSRDTACSPTSAAIELRRARQLRSLPATAAAIERNELSLDHIDLLGRANQPHRAGCLARDEAFLAEQCARLRFRDANRVIEYWCQRADAESDRSADDIDTATARDDSHLHASATYGGTVAVNGVLGPVGGAVFLNELDRLERVLFLADQRDGTTRTAAQRRAAALVTMAQRSATSPAGGRRPKPLFTVLLGDHSFAQLCELANGTVITPRDLVPWLGDAELETVLFDGPSTVISVSHRRSFTGALRRAVEVRDRHCQHPAGCDQPADRCDIDHIVPYAQGGSTSQFNGRPECTTHNRHRDKHDHGSAPLPARPVTRLDELRARLRWRLLREDERNERPPPDVRTPVGPTLASTGSVTEGEGTARSGRRRPPRWPRRPHHRARGRCRPRSTARARSLDPTRAWSARQNRSNTWSSASWSNPGP